MLNTLCLILSIELIINLILFKFDFACPPIIFNLMFTIASYDLILMRNYWIVNIRLMTVIIISVGIAVFSIAGVLVRNGQGTIFITRSIKEDYYDISLLRMCLHILLFFVITILVMVYRIRLSGYRFSFGGLLSTYRKAIDYENLLKIPIMLKVAITFMQALAYIWGYLFSEYLVYKKRISKKCLLMVIVSLGFIFLCYKRGEVIVYIISVFCMILINLRDDKDIVVKRRVYSFIICITFGAIVSFNSMALIMNRSFGESKSIALFSVYLGAPILNLNEALPRMNNRNCVFLSETFHGLYKSMYKYFHYEPWNYYTSRIFRSSASRATGNTYTTFYDFYHDGGMLGVVVLTFIMGIVSCKLYRRIRTQNYNNKMLSSVFYSYIYALIWRSFFANSFYEWIQPSAIRLLVVLYLCTNCINGNIRIRDGGIITIQTKVRKNFD